MKYEREITKIIEWGLTVDGQSRVEAYAQQMLRKMKESGDPDYEKLRSALCDPTPGWDLGLHSRIPGRPALMQEVRHDPPL